jgi:hypothetical protein
VCAETFIRLAIMAGTCGIWPSPAPAAPVPELRITVAVIDFAAIAPATRLQAEQEAARILKAAGISAVWVDFGSKEQTDLPAGALVLRVLPEAGSTHDPKALGVALALGPGAIYATIFFDRVCERAADPVLSEAGASLAVLLGHVIAHEIGHLLLGTNSHSRNGLMSASWDLADMRAIARGRLSFGPDESAKMRAEVGRRHAQPPASR